jgi:hypothetical protein
MLHIGVDLPLLLPLLLFQISRRSSCQDQVSNLSLVLYLQDFHLFTA